MAVREGDALFGQSVAGDGGSGNDERPLWISFVETLGKRDTGEGFTDGDGVNPDCAGRWADNFSKSGKRKPETLAEIGEIFAVAQTLDNPVRGA